MLHLVKLDSAAPDTTNYAAHLKSVLSTKEFDRRPSRHPDYAAENRALIELAREMSASPDNILQKLAETALRLVSRTLCWAQHSGRR